MSARRPPLSRLLLWLIGLVTIIVLIGPLVLVVPLSFTETTILTWPPRGFSTKWFANILSDPQWARGFVNSLVVALLSSVLATVLGTAVAIGLVRGRLRLALAANGLVLAPLAVPLMVIALGFYRLFVHLGISGTVVGLTLAHAVLSVPFVAVTVSASLRTVSREMELAAAGLGAGPARRFLRVTLPLILPGVASGAIFAFLMSWDDVVVALFNTSVDFRTLPVEMWEQIRQSVDPSVAAVSVLFMIVTVGVLSATALIQSGAGKHGQRSA